MALPQPYGKHNALHQGRSLQAVGRLHGPGGNSVIANSLVRLATAALSRRPPQGAINARAVRAAELAYPVQGLVCATDAFGNVRAVFSEDCDPEIVRTARVSAKPGHFWPPFLHHHRCASFHRRTEAAASMDRDCPLSTGGFTTTLGGAPRPCVITPRPPSQMNTTRPPPTPTPPLH